MAQYSNLLRFPQFAPNGATLWANNKVYLRRTSLLIFYSTSLFDLTNPIFVTTLLEGVEEARKFFQFSFFLEDEAEIVGV